MPKPVRRRYSLAELTGLVALVAVACRWPALFAVAIPLVALRCIGRAHWRTLLAVVLSVYLPGLYGFSSDCAHCRAAWVSIFPAFMGETICIMISVILRLQWSIRDVLQAAPALINSLYLALAFVVASRGRFVRIATLLVCVFLSAGASFLLASAIRA